MKRPARVSSQFSEPLHRQLNAYALAATAAGVGLLALAQPAEARIVYTRADEYIEPGAKIPLNLAHGGSADFYFKDTQFGSRYSSAGILWIGSARSSRRNQIVGHHGSRFFASALVAGAEIGPGGPFSTNSYWKTMAVYGNRLACEGQWCEPVTRFLGLKFIINAKTHYGWARLTVHHSLKPRPKVWAVLTGYAYQTIPNKPIKAGQTHGKNEATLGRLAQGASGVSRQK
jgi:hypothetical protein